MPSPLMHTISDARTRWLDGDARAWADYVACCLRLEAEHRQNQAADREPERSETQSEQTPRRLQD